LFIPGENISLEQDLVHPSLIRNASTDSIIKMLKFGLWTNYKMMENSSLNLQDAIQGELNFYKDYFRLKENIQESMYVDTLLESCSQYMFLFQTPSFSTTILQSSNLNLTISPSLTDNGLCTILNGNKITETFNDVNDKIKDFKRILGTSLDKAFEVKRISGSGNIHQKKMWLNVRDAINQKEIKGSMSVAINDWRDYVSVR
jgi:hypothetical protein